jgi:hypothetical protein
MSAALFAPGQIVITAHAKNVLHPADVPVCLARHLSGDWGELCEEDRAENQRALSQGLRLFSVYHDRNRRKFYVITEHDRSVTTILLPEDY